MIRIILSGCSGKMGRMVSECAKKSLNSSIVAGIDLNKNTTLDYPVFNNIEDCNVDGDVIIDFSRPESLDSLIKYSTDKKTPIVICTTGYSEEQLKEIESLSSKVAIFHSANMSIGINLINNLLRQISDKLFGDYDIEIIEKHHNQKVDSPSGTALLLANTIKDSIKDDTEFEFGREGLKKREKKEIGIHAIRGGNIIGDHTVIFAGEGECIELTHKAISREVFAIGAIKAAEFLYKKEPGIYSMDDLVYL
ncbi:4-hydroxy-tetrahydrodipicolinate reductase [Hathewaya histolytica]|uniref:4-hydroxy-tetrahydrodipicolinate reductase n=1 Tax=Hathewaya histolytica TaxID=1498 RepID=A0A4U9RLX6_HATHI|nr:4-hydroxy-tetrahydrodipicolinate reductase [Hathewaya histolytica]VTQ93055.1 dihydrodipicolinate reductase [Hathewaya histolytica]